MGVVNQPIRMPAEWEPHCATWIAWPHHGDDWLEKFPAIDWVYAEITRVLALSERVEILVADEKVKQRAEHCLNLTHVNNEMYRLHVVPNNRSWLRDSMPTAVFSGDKVQWVRWHFNAWAKYDNFSADQKVPLAAAEISQLPVVAALRPDNGESLVLEGGAIETDGEGTLLVTEECLLSQEQERNPGLTRAGYEEAFARYLGVKKTIWLGRGCRGDDTHGHIDDIARFVAPGVVVTVVPNSPEDANYEALYDNYLRLTAATDAQGRRLKVIRLPMPHDVVFGEEFLPASYANFYIANKVVIVPTFNDESDAFVLSELAHCFPGRKVIGIHAVDLVMGQGTLHCLTQQQPQG